MQAKQQMSAMSKEERTEWRKNEKEKARKEEDYVVTMNKVVIVVIVWGR